MSQKPPPKQFIKTPIKGTNATILVSSAKGGVGKSTLAINLAFALQNLGMRIGILDADVYGPSLPKILNLKEKPQSQDNKNIIPLEKYGVQCMSMGFLIDEQTPMMWRGPMVISAIKTITQKPVPRARVATLRKINKINTSVLIDEAIILWFPGPESYTGEDMAEFHVHGGKAVILAVQTR